MRITVRVKPNAKEYKLEKIDTYQFVACVKEPPKENKANKAMIELLSDHFNIPKSQVAIKIGLKSKQKVVEIKDVI